MEKQFPLLLTMLDAGEVDAYKFYGNAGDKIVVRMGSSDYLNPKVSLHAPNGSSLASNSNSIDYSTGISYTLTKDGEYTILASSYWGDETGSYSITLQCVSQCSPPSAPQNLEADARDGQVSLNWETPNDYGCADITNYKIYRDGSLLTTVGDQTNYTDTSVTNGQTYTYTVSAINSAGEGSQSSEAYVVLGASKVTRELPPMVEPGEKFDVGIKSTVNAIGMNVTENYPSGFKLADYSYKGANKVIYSLDTTNENTTLKFTTTDMDSDGFTINYTLEAPKAEGTYTLSGTYQSITGGSKAIGGDNQLVVSKGETKSDGVPNDMEMTVSKYSEFNWATQTPTKSDVVDAVTNAVAKYFSAKNPSKKSGIVDDVTQMVQLYFKL